MRTRTLQRASTDSVGAHRACALLSSYMLLPYVLLLAIVLAFVTSLSQALAAQLFPLFLVLCSLATAIAVSAGSEDEVRLQQLEDAVRMMHDVDNEGAEEDADDSHAVVVRDANEHSS